MIPDFIRSLVISVRTPSIEDGSSWMMIATQWGVVNDPRISLMNSLI
jgi:hypothetical protein